MFLKTITINKTKRLWYIMLGAITVALILILITVVLMNDDITRNKKYNMSGNTSKDLELFNLTSYNTEYEMQVISNKNTNKYLVKEWYENLGENELSFRYETSNEQGDIIEYNISNNNISIKSSNQKLEYQLSDYVLKKKNLISISTFFSLYKKIEELENSSNLFKLENKLDDNKEYYTITFNKEELAKSENIDEFSEYEEFLENDMHILKLEIILDTSTNRPIEYLVYTDEDKLYIDITYNFFNINEDFTKKVFAFFDK